jgi:UvrD-like helicase family protein
MVGWPVALYASSAACSVKFGECEAASSSIAPALPSKGPVLRYSNCQGSARIISSVLPSEQCIWLKGLEFKAVAVIACDDDVLPLQSRIESVADEVELDDVYETERQLLYVACTRARDRLMVSCVSPGSEFLADLE